MFQAAYTWAHAIDNSSDPLTPAAGNNEFPRNSLDLAAERGNSDFDVRQRLVLNYSWALPIGRGHAHLAEGFGGGFFEGWEVAGITTFSGGLPYDIFTALDTAHTGQQQRPDYSAAGTPLPITNPRTQTGPNLGLFSDPPFGSAGNLGRNHFYGPGVNNWDILLQKTLSLSERFNLQFPCRELQLVQSRPVRPTGEPHLRPWYVRPIYHRSEATGPHHRRPANPTWDEAELLTNHTGVAVQAESGAALTILCGRGPEHKWDAAASILSHRVL